MMGESLMVDAFGVLGGAHAGRQWVAGIVGVVDAAALHAILGTACAFGVGVGYTVAVVGGIGVDDAADGAMLCGDLGLDAAPGSAVACDDHRAFDGDAEAVELFIIFAGAVVDVDERAGDIAVG